jgi:hypothetical protein
MPSDFQRLTFQIFTDASQVTVKFIFGGWVYQMYPMLGAEGNVYIIFN